MSRQKGKVVPLFNRSETSQQALDRLFSEHGAALRSFLRVRMGAEDDLEDVVQEVFIRLAKIAGLAQRLPADGDNNRSFIFAIANNLVVDLERHKQVRHKYAERQQAQAREEDERFDITPESIALASEELERIKQVIMELEPNWRDAFILNRFQYKSYREIAAEMNVTIKQVENYMKNALLRLRRAAVDLSGAEP